jgi:hypothetical protein
MLAMRIKVPAIAGVLTLCFTVLPMSSRAAWYRKAVPGAVESDVNQDSIYGSYFKLTGIKLTKGSDFLTVYRIADGTSASIELFKCQEASK